MNYYVFLMPVPIAFVFVAQVGTVFDVYNGLILFDNFEIWGLAWYLLLTLGNCKLELQIALTMCAAIYDLIIGNLLLEVLMRKGNLRLFMILAVSLLFLLSFTGCGDDADDSTPVDGGVDGGGDTGGEDTGGEDTGGDDDGGTGDIDSGDDGGTDDGLDDGDSEEENGIGEEDAGDGEGLLRDYAYKTTTSDYAVVSNAEQAALDLTSETFDGTITINMDGALLVLTDPKYFYPVVEQAMSVVYIAENAPVPSIELRLGYSDNSFELFLLQDGESVQYTGTARFTAGPAGIVIADAALTDPADVPFEMTGELKAPEITLPADGEGMVPANVIPPVRIESIHQDGTCELYTLSDDIIETYIANWEQDGSTMIIIESKLYHVLTHTEDKLELEYEAFISEESGVWAELGLDSSKTEKVFLRQVMVFE